MYRLMILIDKEQGTYQFLEQCVRVDRLSCVVLCAITLLEHPGLRLSTAVTRCQVRREKSAGMARVSRHLRPLLSLAVRFARLIRNEEAGGSNPLSSTRF